MHVSVDPPATQGTIRVTAFVGKSAAIAGEIPSQENITIADKKTTFIDLLVMIHLLGL
jgi:hypothetical protein